MLIKYKVDIYKKQDIGTFYDKEIKNENLR